MTPPYNCITNVLATVDVDSWFPSTVIPVVADNTARSAMFPSPQTNQRVENLAAGEYQRWTGAAWVSETPVNPAVILGGGQTTTNMTAWLRNNAVANVRDFGAIGDGINNDAGAFQDAIDSLPYFVNPMAGPCGGVLYIPRGKYKIETRLNLHRGIRIVGESRESSQLISHTTNGVFQYIDVGNYLQDEIVVEDLAIWQCEMVDPLCGALIEINTGTATSVFFKGTNLILHGGYHGLILQGGVGCSLSDANISKCKSHNIYLVYGGSTPTTTTSTTFQNVYSHLSATGDGFRCENSAYVSFESCGSDSNAGYGYAFDTGTGIALVACGAERNGLGGALLKNTTAFSVGLYVVSRNDSAADDGVVLDNAAGTVFSGCNFTGLSGNTGYAIRVITSARARTVVGCSYAGTWFTNRTNNKTRALYLGDSSSAAQGHFYGGQDNRWGFGDVGGPTTDTMLRVGGQAETGVSYIERTDPEFTSAGVSNIVKYIRSATANTAVIYTQIIGTYVFDALKGAASTITRLVGIQIAEQTQGVNNTNLAITPGGVAGAGNWNIYSSSTRESYFGGAFRLGTTTGPMILSGAGSPESSITAPVGSVYLRNNGADNTSMYIKGSSGGNTGWKPLVSAPILGSGTLTSGSSVVTETTISASDRIMISRTSQGIAPGFLSYTIAAGTGFTVTSSSNTDDSTFVYQIIKP